MNSTTIAKKAIKWTVNIIFAVGAIYPAQSQDVFDDFEGNGTINSWFGDDCNLNTSFSNPFPQGINTSATVLEYSDVGGQFANVRFDVDQNFDLSAKNVFTIKVFVPSSGLTGNEPNQISLKLQDGTLSEPWSTQSEIVKPIVLDEWQTMTFDFLNDNYLNLDGSSLPPTLRTDFNRVLFQINGENNNSFVRAFLDDVTYEENMQVNPVYDNLVWSDEFDEDGAVDSEKWFHQTKLPTEGSWFNGEIQHYTDRIENSFVENGVLHIAGKRETFTDQGYTKQFTSARLNSKYAFQNGKVEVRARLPQGNGTWPAIWTLGKNIDENGGYWDNEGFGTTGWPACGEIDIMEHWGDNQNFIQSAMHTPSSFGGTVNKGGQVIPTASTEFHTYTLEWFPDKMVFSVDGIRHYTYEPEVRNAETWPFDREQYILLNFAFLPHIAPGFTEDFLEIDYVRIYQSSPLSSTNEIPNQFELKSYPNPAYDQCRISYNLPIANKVKLTLQDIEGRVIRTLVDGYQNAGLHEVPLNLVDISSGTYFYTLKTADQTATKKIIVHN